MRVGLALGAAIAPRGRCSRARTTSIPTCPRATRSASTDLPVVVRRHARDRGERGRGERYAKTVSHHAGASRRGRRQVAARGLPRHERHRPEPRRHAAARDRHRAGHAIGGGGGRVREGVARPGRAGSACATATCRRVQFRGRCQRVGAAGRGRRALGTRCEIKNLNTFRFLEKAIDFEVRRPVELIEDGGHRRPGDASLRSGPRRDPLDAEQGRCDDYRYFPDSDLPAAGDRRRVDRRGASARCPSCPRRCATLSRVEYGLSRRTTR